MYNRRKLHPVVFILILAVVCVAATVATLYFMGYRYISTDDNYKFFGKVSSGQPVSGTIHYPDGSTSKLDYFSNTLSYSNGDIYTGDIKSLYRDGTGKMTYFTTKDTYEGQFTKDKLTGTGVYTFRNGDVYNGELLDSVKNGSGTYTWADGSSYVGSYKNGVADGHGIFTFATVEGATATAKYEGYYTNGQKNGEGEFYFANGDYYKGSFVADKRTGKGFYRWANKETYTGTFIDNFLDTRQKDQNGEFITNSDGTYKHGEPAVYTWPNGRTYTGYFEDGKIVTVG